MWATGFLSSSSSLSCENQTLKGFLWFFVSSAERELDVPLPLSCFHCSSLSTSSVSSQLQPQKSVRPHRPLFSCRKKVSQPWVNSFYLFCFFVYSPEALSCHIFSAFQRTFQHFLSHEITPQLNADTHYRCKRHTPDWLGVCTDSTSFTRIHSHGVLQGREVTQGTSRKNF